MVTTDGESSNGDMLTWLRTNFLKGDQTPATEGGFGGRGMYQSKARRVQSREIGTNLI